MKQITLEEIGQLRKCEAIIQRAESACFEAGEALKEIRNKRLYRKDHATFEEYCEKRWRKSGRYVNLVIESHVVVQSLPPDLGTIVPNLAAALAIAKLPPSSRVAVVKKAASNGPLTALSIKAASKPVIDAEEVARDAFNREIPRALIPYWQRAEEVKALMADINAIKFKLKKIHESGDMLYVRANPQWLAMQLDAIWTTIQCAVPYAVCTLCQGHPEVNKGGQCMECKGLGLISKFFWNTVPAERRDMIERLAKSRK